MDFETELVSGSVTRTFDTTGDGGFVSVINSSVSETVELGEVTCGEDCEVFSELVTLPLVVLVRDLVLLLGLCDDLGDGGRNGVAWGGGGGGGGGAKLGTGSWTLILHFPLELAKK